MSDKQDWIDWGGGECPVAPDVMVEVVYRGETMLAGDTSTADDFYWTHGDDAFDIIKYRIIGEAK